MSVLCYYTCSCSHASGRVFGCWDILFWSNLYRNKVPSASCTTAPEQSDVNTTETRTPPAGISFLKYRVYYFFQKLSANETLNMACEWQSQLVWVKYSYKE